MGPLSSGARLADWLDWQQGLHPATIELGLERAGRVLARTGWLAPRQPVITVAGTNGKGSTVAMLDAILRAAGYRTGTFTSPHLIDYRERIRLDGRMVSAQSLVVAFERIAAVLQDDSLTFFEFNTLAALLVFETYAPDVIVLEVGMGGRLDAVNLVSADVAIITPIGLDHMEWLGSDVESIAREKAGIMRPGRPAICNMPAPPSTLTTHAADIGALLKFSGRDFSGMPLDAGRWDYRGLRNVYPGLPRPALPGTIQIANAAGVLAALEVLQERLPVTRTAIEAGLQGVRLSARFDRHTDPGGFVWIVDVAHNEDSARVLAGNLAEYPVSGRTLAVCGMLADKDVESALARLRDGVDLWFAADTDGPRGLHATQLAARATAVGVAMRPAGDIGVAMQAARQTAAPGDRIVVFGSFHTAGPALIWLGDHL
jgi:dihydrofolate synthase/folylpolyglutamate synthase